METFVMDTKEQEIKQDVPLMTGKEAALLCRLGKRSWFRLHSCGKTPGCIKIGASFRWRRSDIELWLRMNCPDKSEFEARKATMDNNE
jgi:predicted DNA-binding transcriptional regulator AlpA